MYLCNGKKFNSLQFDIKVLLCDPYLKIKELFT